MPVLETAPGGDCDGRLPGVLTASARVTRWLRRRHLMVTDVAHGAAPGSRRLFLGPAGAGTTTHVLAAACAPAGAASVDNEALVLRHAWGVLSPGLCRSLPRVLERVDVHGSHDGLVLTAVPEPGAAPGARPTRSATRDLLEASPAWLRALWAESGSGAAPTELGKAAVDAMLAHHDPVRPPPPALASLSRARDRLADVVVPRTVTHGCLCRRHVLLSDGGPGVDDWGLGDVAGDPLGDLGRFGVHLAGPRLPEVVEGSSPFAAAIRHFMSEAMGRLTVPPQLWREVLVLSQLELAFEALRRSDPFGMVRLDLAIGALPGPDTTR